MKNYNFSLFHDFTFIGHTNNYPKTKKKRLCGLSQKKKKKKQPKKKKRKRKKINKRLASYSYKKISCGP